MIVPHDWSGDEYHFALPGFCFQGTEQKLRDLATKTFLQELPKGMPDFVSVYWPTSQINHLTSLLTDCWCSKIIIFCPAFLSGV